jgi:tetratricopeptide (TPR) repeat protein
MADNTDEQKASQLAKGDHIVQARDHSTATLTENIYENVFPRPVEQASIDAALEKLSELPLHTLPVTDPLPAGSRLRAFPRNPSFVGREAELRGVAAVLKARGTATAAVTGLGGIGKSQLATEWVFRYGQYFRGGVFWLSFADANAVPAEIAACRTALGQELRLDAATLPLAEQVQLVLSAWLSELPRLLIFDNCEEEALLAQWRPPSGGCRILLTSRRADWHRDLGVQVLPLAVLPRPESITLLRKYRDELSEADGDAIASELGDLPLALYLAGKYLQEYQGSRLGEPTAYLSSLRQLTPLHHPSLREEEGTYTTAHVQHVERTLALSYERLTRSDAIDAAALKVLARAASFAPGEPIPRELLRATMGAPDDDRLEAVVVKALRRLGTLGLLDKQQGESYRMHRLLAMFVRERSVSRESKAQVDVELALLERAQQLNVAGYPAPLLAWQLHLREVTHVAVKSKSERAASLCNELGSHLVQIGAYSEAQDYLQQALSIRQHVLGPEHHQVAKSLNNLALLYRDQGKYEQAESLFQQALSIWQNVLGPEHPDLALLLENYATLLHQMRRTTEAIKLEERAQAIRAKQIKNM